MRRRDRSEFFHGVVVAVFVTSVLLVMPGITLVWLIDQMLDLRLDRGQLWSFGITATAMMMFMSVRMSGGWLVGIYRHFVLSLGTTAAWLVGFHGFRI